MSSKNYLLDTHCLIWFQEGSSNISAGVSNIISNPENNIFFSQINLFEIAIKIRTGKLPFFAVSVEDVYDLAILDGFNFLEINNQHIYQYQTLHLFDQHRDPFDRLLIATAIYEGMTVLTVDRNFKLYHDQINTFW